MLFRSYIYAYTNGVGCSSVDTLHLTINQNSSYDTSLIGSAPFYWTWFNNGIAQVFNQSGVYTDNSCGTKILRLTLSNNVVYPNPNNGLFNVNLAVLNHNLTNDLILNKNIMITIYDAIGKKVKSQQLKEIINSLTITNCSGGIYFIKIQSADKSINYTTKIFKTN